MKRLTLLLLLTAYAMISNAQLSYFNPTVRVKDYLEPAIPHPEQDREMKDKMSKLKKKPNILIFLIDDMGYGDIGVYGGGYAIGAPTPNIDKLAHEGLQLTSTYAQPTCTPTRAALMTGRIPARSGLTRPTLTGENPKVNPWASENTTAKILSQNGYITSISGKWHLGENKGSLPNDVGYDEWLGFSAVQSEYAQFVNEWIYPDLINKPDRLAAMRKLVDQSVVTGKRGEDNKMVQPITTIEELSKVDQIFADYSEDFIKRAVKQDKPFYLIHSFSKVHNDNYVSKGYKGKSPAAFPYKDAVIEVDDIVGRIMGVLRDLNIDDNTFVFITSDNGPNEDVWPDGGYTPFRGGKGTTWEGGVRVPGIAYWKGMIKPGRISDGLFDLCDLFNTSLSLAGAVDKIPSTNYIDGVDQASFLLSDTGHTNRNAVFMYSEKQFMAVRWQEYKLHMKVFNTSAPRKNLDQSTIENIGMSPWVYNLYVDPKEQLSTGHRYFEWGIPGVMSLISAHLATYKKYPMKDIGLSKPGAD
ncbi:arylsulfatase [Chitinophaga sp. Cy-1792]|uniref:arylsulfatase n=1 Tax=Chitinophaga sp. Cy-1792 TaxID=2608339 RepID=UPI001423C2B2|nr:arylsulfatase [Chitinophaga sp. Cy-1792]NIG52984.1 arylsulfatase [Chitinophaga sp. Cy-1792]